MGEQSTIYENRDSKEILKDKLISPSGTLADFFEISDKAREGGMGEVFFCRDKRDNKFYVLKTIKADIDSKIFKEEAAFSLKLNKNPYVAYTRTIVIEKDILYIVMDYIGKQPYTLDSIVEGETLTKVMNKYHIEPKQALIWAIQFCKGMDFLNKSGMKVHKDIKPDNILISPDNVVKIIDFGLASIEKKGGTPGYRPPEYFDDKKDLTIQSDIYSFGLVLYQMLNNGKLLSDTTKFDKEKKEYEFFDYKNITSKHCQDIIKKCLQIKPRDRYKDFKALEKDLTKYLNKNYPEYKFEDIPAEAMTSQDYFLKGFGLYILYELYGSHPILDIRNQELRFPQEDLYPYFTNSIKLDSHNASAYFYRNLIHQHTGMLPHANILHQDERGAKLQINIDQPGLDTFKGAILNPTYAKYFIKRYTKENTYAYDSYTSIRSEVKLYYFILKVYDIILKTNSKDGECYYLKAKIKNELLKLNLYSSSEVIEDLNKAIKYGFNTIDAMRLKADLLKKDKDYKNAIKCYRKIFELAYKQNPYLMLIVLLKNRNHDIYEVASCYRNIGQYSFIKKFLNKIFAIDKNKYLKIKKDIISFWTYKSAMAKAELYRKQGNINNQIKSYKLALKQHINKSLYNFNRFKAEYLLKVLKTNTASAYNEYGLFSSGLYFIEMNDPGEDWGKGSQFLDSLNNYRIDIFNKEKAEESIQYFNKAIEIDPNYAFAYYNRADMFLFLKKYEKAIRDYNKAIQLAPNLAKTIGIRGTNEIYNHLRGNYGYASGILFSPSRVRSKSHQKIEYIDGIPAFHRYCYNGSALYKESRAIRMLYDKTRILMKIKRYKEALKVINKCINLVNEYKVLDALFAFFERANLYYILKDYNKAIEDYSLILNKLSNMKRKEYRKIYSWVIFYNISKCYQKLDNNKLAEQNYRKYKISKGYKVLKNICNNSSDNIISHCEDWGCLSYNALFKRAEAKFNLKLYKEAIEDYELGNQINCITIQPTGNIIYTRDSQYKIEVDEYTGDDPYAYEVDSPNDIQTNNIIKAYCETDNIKKALEYAKKHTPFKILSNGKILDVKYNIFRGTISGIPFKNKTYPIGLYVGNTAIAEYYIKHNKLSKAIEEYKLIAKCAHLSSSPGNKRLIFALKKLVELYNKTNNMTRKKACLSELDYFTKKRYTDPHPYTDEYIKKELKLSKEKDIKYFDDLYEKAKKELKQQ